MFSYMPFCGCICLLQSVMLSFACFVSVVRFVHCFSRCDANHVFMNFDTVFDLTKFLGRLGGNL